ncbi:MAG: cytochrome c oxidase assembly protein [Sulfuricaulis sp.]
MQQLITYLKPWEFSPTVLLACLLPLMAYTRGLFLTRRAGERTGFWRPLAFYLGVILIYAVLQTYIDYLSGHMFWVHRLQHLTLHHVAPLLLALSAPLGIMARGVPDIWRERILLPFWRHPAVQKVYEFLQHPIVAPTLFVGLIFFWLSPAVHFTAMLNETRYKLMNWSMALDGILFWWLMIAPPHAQRHTNISYPMRLMILWWVMILQILPGAYIALSHTMLYDVYDICGRAWVINPLTDQEIGGLLTWIPAAMMSVVGSLIVLSYILNDKQSPSMKHPAIAGAGAK